MRTSRRPLQRYYVYRRRWPDLGNAVKYALAQSVVVLGAFHPVFGRYDSSWGPLRLFWCVSRSHFGGADVATGSCRTSRPRSTCLRGAWCACATDCASLPLIGGVHRDVKMDWGLLRFDDSQHPLLRRDRLFPHVWVYYAAIVVDFLLRFLWTLTITPFLLTDFLEVAAALRLTGWLAGLCAHMCPQRATAGPRRHVPAAAAVFLGALPPLHVGSVPRGERADPELGKVRQPAPCRAAPVF
jgi:hypothetical protein